MVQRIQFIATLFILTISTSLFAQTELCDGLRYKFNLFPDLIVTSNVHYGENSHYNQFLDLYMDIYEPKGDDSEKRPLIILVYGGSFSIGSRSDVSSICKNFARKGYVAATIDYRRLISPATDSIQVYSTLAKATGDLAAAIRYLRKDAATNNYFRINPDLIFTGGISAGALIAINQAYLDEDDTDYSPLIQFMLDSNGGFEGNTGDCFEYSSDVQGVINFSGSIKDSNWIDANDPPMYSAHDDMDSVVPYFSGISTGLPSTYYMEGSGKMHQRLDELGIRNELFTVQNSRSHVSFFLENAIRYEDEVLENAAFFLHDVICGIPTDIEDLQTQTDFLIYPNPSTGYINIELNDYTTDYTVEIYNLTGSLVHQAFNVKTLQLSELPKGVYQATIKLEGTNTAPHYKKIILH